MVLPSPYDFSKLEEFFYQGGSFAIFWREAGVIQHWYIRFFKQVASNSYRYTVLVPRLNTDPRRDDKTINPYIAFRRRLDKVQTRKKQKTEIQTYEKILRLNYAIKRSLVLVEIMKQREKAKLLLVNLNEAIFDQQYRVMDNNNQELDRLTATVLNSRFGSPDVSSTKKKFTASSRLENGKIPSVFSPFMKVNTFVYCFHLQIKF